MANIIDGKAISEKIRDELTVKVDKLREEFRILPSLAVILVGKDPASEVYVRNKEKATRQVGMNSIAIKLSSDISQEEIIAEIKKLNEEKNIHGILVQLPLPKHIDSKAVIHAIDPRKDVDGFHVNNVGKLSIGDVDGDDGAIVPCTPLGCVHLLKSAKGNDLKGLKVTIVGSSNIVGRPLARLLMIENCTVTIANRSTKDLKAECINSDVIISAAGVPNLITADMVKDGAVVIDVGINRVTDENGNSKLVGDVDFENVKNVASAITPVPGGVGPMTISYLLKNTLECCLRAQKK